MLQPKHDHGAGKSCLMTFYSRIASVVTVAFLALLTISPSSIVLLAVVYILLLIALVVLATVSFLGSDERPGAE